MSKPAGSPSLPDLVKEIEAGTEHYRAAATELTKRIKVFEAWLNKLPGKVPASCYENEDPEGDFVFELSLERDGKQWSLYHKVLFIPDESTADSGGLLRDASVEKKARAMRMFPELLKAIREAQHNYIEHSVKVASEFDDFAKSLGIKGGE